MSERIHWSDTVTELTSAALLYTVLRSRQRTPYPEDPFVMGGGRYRTSTPEWRSLRLNATLDSWGSVALGPLSGRLQNLNRFLGLFLILPAC